MLKTLALLPFLAIPAFAQQAPQPAPGMVPPMTFHAPPFIVKAPPSVLLRAACPVGIAASPHNTPQSLWVTAVEDASLSGKSRGNTGIQVHLSSLEARTMSHLTLAILYLKRPEGIIPVSNRASITQQQTFELNAADAAALTRNLLLTGYVDIQGIQVLKVAYTDGTHWQASAQNPCSIAFRPDHFVLVGAR